MMADVILTLQQVENFFHEVTCNILGYANPTLRNRNVRISFLTEGAPSMKLDEDVAFIRVNTQADPITMQRDVTYSEQDVDIANRTVSYTRVQTISWVLYGPNAFNNAELIRRSLYNLDVRKELAGKNLYIIPDATVPVRLPEEFGGRWWERADFTANFNESVIVAATVPYIQSVNTRIYTVKGEIN
jgi:hypothetical protein